MTHDCLGDEGLFRVVHAISSPLSGSTVTVNAAFLNIASVFGGKDCRSRQSL